MDSIQTFLNKLVHLYGDKAFLDEDQFLQLSEAHFSQSPGKRKVLALLIEKGVAKYLVSWKGLDESPSKASAEQVRDSLVVKLTDANLASKEAAYWAVSAMLSVLIGRDDLYPITREAIHRSNDSDAASKPIASNREREQTGGTSSSGVKSRAEPNEDRKRKGIADYDQQLDRAAVVKSSGVSVKNKDRSSEVYSVVNTKFVFLSYCGVAILGVGGPGWALYERNYVFAPICIGLAVLLYFFSRPHRLGTIVDVTNRTLEFPAIGVAANNVSDYFSPSFLLRRFFGRIEVSLDDLRQISAEDSVTETWNKEKAEWDYDYTYTLRFSGYFGNAFLVFDQGKRDELFSLLREVNSMGIPVVNA